MLTEVNAFAKGAFDAYSVYSKLPKEYLTEKDKIAYQTYSLEEATDFYQVDSNKEIVKQLSVLYNNLSNNMNQSYYQGQKSAYEEMLLWFKNFQNKSTRFLPPKTVKDYLMEKGTKPKNSNDKKYNRDKEELIKKASKSDFNYLYYNQTFDVENNNIRNNHEFNVYPTSVENAINKKVNKLNNPFNVIFNNNLKNNEDNFHRSLLSNSSIHNNQYRIINSTVPNINNNINNTFNELEKPKNYINNNFLTEYNLKIKK